MKNLAKTLGLILSLALLVSCGGGGGGGGGASGGGSSASTGRSTYSGDFSVGGKSYNTFVMDGNDESGKISLCGTNGFLDGTYQKQATNAAAAINGTFTITFDNGESITITLSSSNISFSSGSIDASGSATVNGDVVVTEYIIATALDNGIQFIIRKPNHPSYATGFGQVIIEATFKATHYPPNRDYVSILYPFVDAGQKFNFYYQIDSATWNSEACVNGDIEITARNGVGAIVPNGFNYDTSTVVSYSGGRPHVNVTGGTVPTPSLLPPEIQNQFSGAQNAGIWVGFVAAKTPELGWSDCKWLMDYTASNNTYADINPDSNWINMFNANYKNAYQQGYQYLSASYYFRCSLNIPNYEEPILDIHGNNFWDTGKITCAYPALADIP